MKNTRRIIAGLICAVLAVTCFAGCHQKNETAVTVGKEKFTSGYYACALVFADTEARQKVDSELTKKGKSTDKVNYMKQKIDGVKYEKWVKNRAIENIKINAGYKALCKEKKITLDKDNKSTATDYAEQMWTTYGYEQIFSENGVSKETFIKYTVDTYYSTKYFDAVYGKDGSNPVTDDQMKDALKKNYELVYKLETDISSLTEDEKKAKKAEYEMYLEQYKSGVSFEEIYISVNGEEAAEESTEGGVSINSQEDAEAYNNGTLQSNGTPADKRAELIGNDESDIPSTFYEDVKEMQIGEAKLIENDTTIAFIVRLDVLSDHYYIESKDETLRKLYASDKSNDDAKAKADKLGVKKVDSAIDVFKVKKIKYPETTTIGG